MKFTGIIAAALTVGAAVAAPAPVKKADPLASVLSIASGLKTEVASKLSSIPVAGEITAKLSPTIESTLEGVVIKIQEATADISPLVMGLTSIEATQGDVDGITTAVSDVQETVAGIQTTIKGLTGSAAEDVLSNLQPQLASVQQVVFPVLTLALSTTSNIPAGDIVTTELVSVTQELQGVAAGVITLVTGLLGGVL